VSAKPAFVVLSDDEALVRGGPGAPHPEEVRNFGWAIYEQDAQGRLVEFIGRDGGEPEDQLLVRDWAWVTGALNAERAEVDRLKLLLAERAEQAIAAGIAMIALGQERDKLRLEVERLRVELLR
jgi:hypothetical protein